MVQELKIVIEVFHKVFGTTFLNSKIFIFHSTLLKTMPKCGYHSFFFWKHCDNYKVHNMKIPTKNLGMLAKSFCVQKHTIFENSQQYTVIKPS